MRNCGQCHECDMSMVRKLDGEEWCPTCQAYRRYRSHGWAYGVADTGDPMCPPKELRTEQGRLLHELDCGDRSPIERLRAVQRQLHATSKGYSADMSKSERGFVLFGPSADHGVLNIRTFAMGLGQSVDIAISDIIALARLAALPERED